MGLSGACLIPASMDPKLLADLRIALEKAGITPGSYAAFQLGLGEKLPVPKQEDGEL